jgi:hypothetical protein
MGLLLIVAVFVVVLLWPEERNPEPLAKNYTVTVTPTMKSRITAEIRSTVTPEATNTPVLAPVERAPAYTGKPYQTLLLYRSDSVAINSDINFCKLSEYYGFDCRRVDLAQVQIEDAILRDAEGQYYRTTGISAYTLERLSEQEQNILKAAVNIGGMNLLVSDVADVPSQAQHKTLSTLSEGSVLNVIKPNLPAKGWIVSEELPEVTRQFTGQSVTFADQPVYNYGFGLAVTQSKNISVLIRSADDSTVQVPVFVRYKKGSGSLFINAGIQANNLEKRQLYRLYFSGQDFLNVVPTMLFMNFAGGKRAWHSEHVYANLTIDDPALSEPWASLSYIGLLNEAKVHSFHVTIAFVPKNYMSSQPQVLALFRQNPDRLSLAIHGNNHKYGENIYEFSFYSEVPLATQEANITEALQRMQSFEAITGIPYGRVMIFPMGISPEQTLVLLKKHNFNLTVNGGTRHNIPLDATVPNSFDFNMYPAAMDFGNFASLSREWPEGEPYLFKAFIGQPILMYTHQDYFSSGMQAFNPTADTVNRMWGGVEWRSLDYIGKHLFLERENDDGSIDVMMFGNDLVLTNASNQARVYHIQKSETLNIPIVNVTVNVVPFEYRVERETLRVDVKIPARVSAEVVITYDTSSPLPPIPTPRPTSTPLPASKGPSKTVLLDAFEYLDSPLNHGWKVTEGEGKLETIADDEVKSRVMLATTSQGKAFKVEYHVHGPLPEGSRYFSFRIKSSGDFVVYVNVQADDDRSYYLQYQPGMGSPYTSGGMYALYPLGTAFEQDRWNSITRDLAQDLFDVFGLNLTRVNYIVLRGSYRVDDVLFRDRT